MNVHTNFGLSTRSQNSSPEIWAGSTRLVGGEPPDEFLHDPAELFVRFTGFEIGEDLHHHRNHHVHPARADQ